MKSLKMPNGQVTRWLQEIGNYNLIVTHRPGRQLNNADALSRRPCKVYLRHQERNTEEKSEHECATTIEQVRVTIRSKQSHSVEPNLMNSEILKNWEPEEIRESQLNDKKNEIPIQLYIR
jgi:hypothetical protein